MADPREARLFVLAGPDLARSFPLGERATLGRSDECEVVLRDRSISRKHALIARQGEGWFVQDLGSTNGVTKNGTRAERFELADGDEFQLGDLPVRFKLQAVAAEEIEFDFAGPAPSAPLASPAAPVPSAPPRRSAQPEVGPADEIEIEEDIEIEIEGSHQPGATAPRPLAATAIRPARVERRSGFFSGDLEQQPFWMRVLLFLALLGVAGGLAYGVFLAVQMLREGL